jgi:hypothetical protein
MSLIRRTIAINWSTAMNISNTGLTPEAPESCMGITASFLQKPDHEAERLTI